MTPGQAAYETLRRLDDGDRGPWDKLSDEGRAIWEDAAQAAIDVHEGAGSGVIVRVDGKFDEKSMKDFEDKLRKAVRNAGAGAGHGDLR